MNYKMNQNAIDELVAIHNRLKLLSYTMASIKQNASKEIKLALKNVHSLDIDSMNWSELYENEEAIRDRIMHEAMARLDWFRCDVDANCCNRSDYEPLKVEVVK